MMKTGMDKESRQFNNTPASDNSVQFHTTSGLIDNRNTTTLQRQLMQGIDNSPIMTLQRQRIENSFGESIQRTAEEDEELLQGKLQVAQRQGPEEEELLQGKFETTQRQEGLEEEEPLQGKFESTQRQGPEEEELLQGRFESTQRKSLDEEEEPLQGKFTTELSPIQRQEQTAQPENQTGIPDQLKAGIESLSGMDMSDVCVHYNSTKPAQLNALAYAQGNDIHLGSGQERHLPHEAWHTVQQRQDRVKPTMQMSGHQINDDAGLEKEADVMGAQALAETSITHDYEALKSDTNPFVQRAVTQRAVGMEFECSNLEITEEPKGAKKGDIIAQDKTRHWDMTYEETSEGTPVVEFVVEPAAEIKTQLINAVTDMAGEAQKLDKDEPSVIGSYKIKKAGKIEGAIQVTMGTPLAKLPELFSEYRGEGSSSPSLAYERYNKMLAGSQVTERVTTTKQFKVLGIKKLSIPYQSTSSVTKQVYDKAPDGTEVRHLPDSTKGFILLIMDYIVQGYVPPTWRGKASIPFAKGLYPLMARTDFTSIFKTLPQTEIDRLSEVNDGTGKREMKDSWWKWLVKKALDKDNLTPDFLDKDQLINYKLQNLAQTGGDPKRGEFLKHLPEQDLLKAEGYLGLGKLGSKADVSENDPKKFAPIFELRKPYGSSASYKTWVEKAKETWGNYLKIVGERMNIGGKIP